MTNEEKAIEIADNAKKQTYFDSRCNDLAGNKSYEAAMVMAEWKDQQFEKYLKDKINGLTEICRKTNSMVTVNRCGNMIDILNRIINQLFKEE